MPSVKHVAVPNATCVWLCAELGQEHPWYCSANNVGNVFEWLVWAAYEEERYDSIASLIAHAVTRFALQSGFTGPAPIEV